MAVDSTPEEEMPGAVSKEILRVRIGSEPLTAFWKRAVRLAQSATLAGAALLYFTCAGGAQLALGLLLGGAVSILRFQLRYRALIRHGTVRALVRARLLSYAINAGVIAFAFALRGKISPWSTVAGLFVMNAAVIAAELLSPDAKQPATNN